MKLRDEHRPGFSARLTAGGLVLSGELDIVVADEADAAFHAALGAVDGDQLHVIMTDLGFCDSAGLRTLIYLQKKATAQGTTVVFRDPTPAFRRLVDVAGLTHFFTLE